MQREQCRVGMTVTFGRENGEKTVGVVEKCNPTKAKVRTTEARGKTPAGTMWNVPYSLLTAEGVVGLPSMDELVRRVLTILPTAEFHWDNDGQVVIYTGVKQGSDRSLQPLEVTNV